MIIIIIVIIVYKQSSNSFWPSLIQQGMSRRNSIPRGKVRIRRDSGTKLDYYNKIVSKSILIHQNPVTGLFAASSETDHAWVRDNVYSIMSGK